MGFRFELVSDPKSKIDASKFFEIVPKQGTLPAGGDRNPQATSVTVSHRSFKTEISIHFSKIIFKPTSEVHLRETEIIVVSVINIAPSPKITESGGQINHSTTHIGASQSTLKAGSEAGQARNALANQQAAGALVEEEVARIRLKISAKATYSK